MIRSILFTVALALAFFVGEHYYGATWLHPGWKMLLVFFLSISLLTHRLVSTGLQGNQERFVPLYLAATVARFVLGLAFVGVFLFYRVERHQIFVVNFLVLYICYTGFEIWAVNRNLRHDS